MTYKKLTNIDEDLTRKNTLESTLDLVEVYLNNGVLKFEEIISHIDQEDIHLNHDINKIINNLKIAYAAHYTLIPDEIADEMTDPRVLRKFNYDDFLRPDFSDVNMVPWVKSHLYYLREKDPDLLFDLYQTKNLTRYLDRKMTEAVKVEMKIRETTSRAQYEIEELVMELVIAPAGNFNCNLDREINDNVFSVIYNAEVLKFNT